jgi:type IV pilus assembly protein PilA
MRTPQRPDRDTTSDGFTLVELVIVMTIISTLAAIAVPTFLNQRQKSYQAQMQSDLQTLVVSETAYSADNNGVYSTDLTELGAQGYRASENVTAHVKVTGSTFHACTKSSSVASWLVYDSATGSRTTSATDCA